MTIATTDEDFLYEQISAKLQDLIKQKVLKNGDKLMSVRALSKEYGVSISTAFKAYSELEIKGFIEARPKSGFYVHYHPIIRHTPPKTPVTFDEPKEIGMDDLLSEVYRNIRTPGVMKLVNSSPPKQVVPVGKLRNAVAERLRSEESSWLGYEDLEGNAALKRQIAKHAFNHGTVVAEPDIITTNGCMEALAFSLSAITQAGDVVAVESPGYWGFYNLLKQLKLKVVEIPVDATNGISLEALEHALGRHPIKAVLLTPNFSSPTGSYMEEDQKKALVALLAKEQIPLVENDVFGDVYFTRLRPRTCKSFDSEGLVILCSSFSKTLAPGFRVGWCMPGRYKNEILKIKQAYSLSSSTLMHGALAGFFEKGRYDLHLRNLRSRIYSNMRLYMEAVQKYFPDHIEFTSPKGGYALWIQFNQNLDAFELHRAAVAEKICIMPGQVCNINGRFANCIRINYSLLFNAEVEKAIKTIGELSKKLCKDGTVSLYG